MDEQPDRETIDVILFKSAITEIAQQLLKFSSENVNIIWKCQSHSTNDVELLQSLLDLEFRTRSMYASLEMHDDNLTTYIGRHKGFAAYPVPSIQRLSQHSLHLLRSLQHLKNEGFTDELRSYDMRLSVRSLRDALREVNGINGLLATVSGYRPGWSYLKMCTAGPTGPSGPYGPSALPSSFDLNFHERWEAVFRPLSASALAWQQTKEKTAMPAVVYPSRRSISPSRIRAMETMYRATEDRFETIIQNSKRNDKEPPRVSKARQEWWKH